MKKIILLVLFVFFCSYSQAAEDVVTRVLKSTSLYDLYGAKKPNRKQLNFVTGISDNLIKTILADPSNDRAWQALHKFRTYTDAGLTTMFNDSCFYALQKQPLIFYNRYMAGDTNALDRAEDSAWGFSETETESSNKEDTKYLYKNLDQIKNIKSNNPRHALFVERFTKAIKDREIEIQQLEQSLQTGTANW